LNLDDRAKSFGALEALCDVPIADESNVSM
jgi:hypothetical protein